ncbi:MAG TPA: methylmalonyl-CoA epimerase [Anaerolineae bacterium]|nr:methylmalonyl-CoA epimerase [Anaerolineae bacterium]
MSIKRIDHIAIVVQDIDASLNFWEDALGLDVSHIEEVPDQESLVAFLPSGESEVELVEPTSESSGVAKYLAKRGPGMHHICLEVDDIALTLARLKRHGVQLINAEPTIGTGGKKIAFIHPKSTGGVLVELYELTPDEPQRRNALVRRMRHQLMVRGYAAGAGLREFVRTWRDRDGRGDKAGIANGKARVN